MESCSVSALCAWVCQDFCGYVRPDVMKPLSGISALLMWVCPLPLKRARRNGSTPLRTLVSMPRYCPARGHWRGFKPTLRTIAKFGKMARLGTGAAPAFMDAFTDGLGLAGGAGGHGSLSHCSGWLALILPPTPISADPLTPASAHPGVLTSSPRPMPPTPQRGAGSAIAADWRPTRKLAVGEGDI